MFGFNANVLSSTELHPNVHVGVLSAAHLHDGQAGLELRPARTSLRHLCTEVILDGSNDVQDMLVNGY